MLRIERVDNTHGLLDRPERWDALAGGVAFREVGWLGPWCKHLGTESEPYILVARDQQEQVVGILPLCVTESGSHARTLSMMGAGLACSDYLSVLADDEHAVAIATAMGEFLAGAAADSSDGWDFINFDGVVEDDPRMISVANALAASGASVHAQSRMSTWYKPRESSWDDHLKIYGKTQRRKMRRWVKTVQETEELSLSLPETIDQVHEFLDALIDLHQRRWNAVDKPGSYADPRCRLFAHDAAEAFFGNDRLYLALIAWNGQPIAADLHYIGENRQMYCYSSGYDADFSELEPGRIMMAEAIKHMYQHQLAGIDYLRGDEPYKRRMAATPARVLQIRVAAPTLWPRLRHATWWTGFELKQLVRKGVGRTPVEVFDLAAGTLSAQ